MKTLDEAAGKFYIGKNTIKADNEALSLEKLREQAEAEKLNKLLLEAEQAKQEEIDRKLATTELVPNGNKVILQKYPRNPYRKIMEGSIIVDYDGTFKNPDTGEEDKLKELVSCAKVIEVGPECKWLAPGDDVYFDMRTVYPLPFMSMGYLLITEPQVFCIVNEGLKARFNMK